MAKHKRKTGLVPGSIIFTGNKKVEKVLIHHLQYDEEQLKEKALDNHSKNKFIQSSPDIVDWYDVRGIHDTQLIEFLGTTFDMHPIMLEAVADIHQRAKFDEYEKGIFITLRALKFDKKNYQVQKEHVAIYFNRGFLATFQETESDLFFAVRDRIHGNKGRIRKRGTDYLAYALIDALVDNYYSVLEDIEEAIEQLEEQMMSEQHINNKSDIHRLKKELLVLRKSISPLREAIGRFSKIESEFVQESSHIYIRDLYENTIQVMDTIESYRDILTGLQDLFISEISFRMNKVMQLLTLISVIFIPLTFLAGIYGMNFENMPELHYKYGYFTLLGVMLVLFILLLLFFKRKRWL